MNSKSTIRITKILFWIGIGLLFFSFVNHEYNGGITWDEMVEYRGTVDQIRFAIDTLKGNEVNYERIHYNLDFYGITNKITPFLVQKVFDLSLRSYFIVSHITIVIFAGLTCCLLYWASKFVGIRNQWLPPLLLISTPIYSGHSIFNIKDIPFAFFYTAFTYSLINYSRFNIHQKSLNHRYINPWILLFISSVIAGSLASMKMVMLLPIIFTQILALILTEIYNVEGRIDKKLSSIYIPSLNPKIIII